MLTATLPFGGVTLVEYQARLLIGAGAAQLVIMVGRLTPELMGAINRVARRGVTVDTVRSAAEAAEKLHPLSRVLMLADGLTTTPDVVAAMAREGGEALLVVDEDERGDAFERIGGGRAWAGIARLDPRRMGELAALPRDYDFESTLVRLASQARAAHLVLPDSALASGHGIDHRGAMLVERGRHVLAASVSGGRTWFDRMVIAPLARLSLPLAVPRAVPSIGIGLVCSILGLGALGALWMGSVVSGTIFTFMATIGFALAARLAMLRDEPRHEQWLEWAALGLPALAVLLVGRAAMIAHGNGGPQIVAVAGVAAAILVERAAMFRPWWGGSPPAYLGLVTLAALAGSPVIGMALAALYAVMTLAAEIEQLRQEA